VNALRKLTWVELKLFTRDPLSLVFTLALPFFFLIVLNGVFGNEPEIDPVEDVWRGVGPADYYVPAYLGLVMAAIGVLNIPVRLASYREQGVLRRFRASAMPLWAVLGSQIIIALVTAVVGAVSITIASSLIYGTDFPSDVLLLIPAFVLAALSFAALGVVLGSVLPTSRSAQGAGIMLFFVMFLLSGSGPPRDVLSDAMRQVGNALPLTHVVTLLQDPWLGYGWATNASLIVGGILVGSVALSVRFFRWE
jgi:ABC-2 type transport system permease protein